MGKKESRIEKIISYLKENNGASVKDLANMLNVSEMTIRRDLRILEENGIVNNVYGSAIYNPRNCLETSDDNYNLITAIDSNREDKERIGKFAASLIEEDDTIILDAGSTIESLARHIDNSKKLKIICITLNVLNIVKDMPNLQVIFPGGFYHSSNQMCESEESISLLQRTRAHKVFISAAGVHEKLGITAANLWEINTKKACIASSAEVILVCDSTKFGSVKSAYFADLKDLNCIITDNKLSKEWEEIINNLGIKLYKV